MKTVYVIHGCPSDAEKAMNPQTRTYVKHWIPWITRELSQRGIKVETPHMPNPWEPDYDAFKREFEKYPVTKSSILFGHSCGCAFLVRWLGESKQNIDTLILVAPWKVAEKDDSFRKSFYEYAIDESIRSRVKRVVIFTADDEEQDGKESAKIFHEALGGEVIELQGRGHYTIRDMGTEEFPELLAQIVGK